MKLHLLQLYLTIPSWGRTPVQQVTTPLVRISWFKCSCLGKGTDNAHVMDVGKERASTGLTPMPIFGRFWV